MEETMEDEKKGGEETGKRRFLAYEGRERTLVVGIDQGSKDEEIADSSALLVYNEALRDHWSRMGELEEEIARLEFESSLAKQPGTGVMAVSLVATAFAAVWAGITALDALAEASRAKTLAREGHAKAADALASAGRANDRISDLEERVLDLQVDLNLEAIKDEVMRALTGRMESRLETRIQAMAAELDLEALKAEILQSLRGDGQED